MKRRASSGIPKKPRAILIFVPAGEPVDEVIGELVVNPEPGDPVAMRNMSDYIKKRREIMERQGDLGQVVRNAADLGIPLPGFMSALACYDACRGARLSANLIMAQRHHLRAHRYERIDEEGTFHTEWDA